MGLGKTIQTIVAIRLLLSNKEIKNCLIIVPVSLMSNWIYEFKVLKYFSTSTYNWNTEETKSCL